MAIFTRLRSMTLLAQAPGPAAIGAGGDTSGISLGGQKKAVEKNKVIGPLKEIIQNVSDPKSTPLTTPAVEEPVKPSEEISKSSKETSDHAEKFHQALEHFKKTSKHSNHSNPSLEHLKKASEHANKFQQAFLEHIIKETSKHSNETSEEANRPEPSLVLPKETSEDSDHSADQKDAFNPLRELRFRQPPVFLPTPARLKKKFRSLYKVSLRDAVLVNNIHKRVVSETREVLRRGGKRQKRLSEERPAKKRKKESNLLKGVFML